jgi:hypothetical protein
LIVKTTTVSLNERERESLKKKRELVATIEMMGIEREKKTEKMDGDHCSRGRCVRKKKTTLEGSDEASGSLRCCCGSELPALGMEGPLL